VGARSSVDDRGGVALAHHFDAGGQVNGASANQGYEVGHVPDAPRMVALDRFVEWAAKEELGIGRRRTDRLQGRLPDSLQFGDRNTDQGLG
jgi:hypothetical protein